MTAAQGSLEAALWGCHIPLSGSVHHTWVRARGTEGGARQGRGGGLNGYALDASKEAPAGR